MIHRLDWPHGLSKSFAWSDCGGDIESRFTKDEILTHVMIYWATNSIGTSFLPYYDYSNASALTWVKEGIKNWGGSRKVPAAFALFPEDISSPATRMGRAILRCTTLDRNAARWPFRRNGRTATIG